MATIDVVKWQETYFRLNTNPGNTMVSSFSDLVRPTLYLPFIISIVAVVANTGCDSPQRLQAVPRSSSKQLTTREDYLAEKHSLNAATEVSQDLLDVSFIHDDHFLVIKIDVQSIYTNPDLKEFQWQRPRSILSKYVGFKNSDLADIKSIWITLDQAIVLDQGDSKEANAFAIIVDFLKPFSKAELEKTIAKRKTDKLKRRQSPNQSNPRGEVEVIEALAGLDDSVIISLGPTRIAMGHPGAIANIQSATGDSKIAKRMATVNEDADVFVSLSFHPIRGALEGVMGMAGQMLPSDAKPLLKLPSKAEYFDMAMSLRGGDLMNTRLETNSQAAAKEISKIWSQMLGSGNIGTVLGFLSSQIDTSSTLFDLKLTQPLNRIKKQIESANLYQVESDGFAIVSRFKRPRDASELLQSAVSDLNHHLQALQRLKRFQVIATALENYYNTNQQLPPANFFGSQKQKDNPFGWRVALLPFLDRVRVFEKIDFSQAWNSEKNEKIRRRSLADLFGPFKQPVRLVMPTGPGWVTPDPESGGKISKIEDKLPITAILVEARCDPSQHWMQADAFGPDDLALMGREDENAFVYIGADFKVHVIKNTPQNRQAVLTSRGGEKIRRSNLLQVLGFEP